MFVVEFESCPVLSPDVNVFGGGMPLKSILHLAGDDGGVQSETRCRILIDLPLPAIMMMFRVRAVP